MSEEHGEGASFVDEDPVEYASRKAIEHRDGAWEYVDQANQLLQQLRACPDSDPVVLAAIVGIAQASLSRALDSAAQATAYQGFVDAGR